MSYFSSIVSYQSIISACVGGVISFTVATLIASRSGARSARVAARLIRADLRNIVNGRKELLEFEAQIRGKRCAYWRTCVISDTRKKGILRKYFLGLNPSFETQMVPLLALDSSLAHHLMVIVNNCTLIARELEEIENISERLKAKRVDMITMGQLLDNETGEAVDAAFQTCAESAKEVLSYLEEKIEPIGMRANAKKWWF